MGGHVITPLRSRGHCRWARPVCTSVPGPSRRSHTRCPGLRLVVLSLVIVGLFIAVLVLASKLHETRYQLRQAETRLEDYADTFDLLQFAAKIPAEQIRLIMAQAQQGKHKVKSPSLGEMTGIELKSTIDAVGKLQSLAQYLGQTHASHLYVLAQDLEPERRPLYRSGVLVYSLELAW